jgi:hypothetical protein
LPHRYLLVEPADRDVERLKQIDSTVQKLGRGEQVYAWPSEENPKLVIYMASKRPRAVTQGEGHDPSWKR